VEFLLEALQRAAALAAAGDPDLYSAVWISLRVSVTAILITTCLAVPAGFVLSTVTFPGRNILIAGCQTLMAVPTVVIGLLLFTFLFRQGPLGTLELLFTPSAMIIGQVLLTLPLVIALVYAALRQIDRRYLEEAWLLGAGPWQRLLVLLRQGRLALAVAIFTGFTRAISEVGSAMMVGGNIRGFTRNITTSIALETSKGEFALGIALGLILLFIAFCSQIMILSLKRRLDAR
jgi:tungstate transport system permease protein